MGSSNSTPTPSTSSSPALASSSQPTQHQSLNTAPYLTSTTNDALSPTTDSPSNTTTRKPTLQQPGPRLILGGIVFTLASTLVTRRALTRRRLPLSASAMVSRTVAPGVVRSSGQASASASAIANAPSAPRMPPESKGQATAAREVGGGGIAGVGRQVPGQGQAQGQGRIGDALTPETLQQSPSSNLTPTESTTAFSSSTNTPPPNNPNEPHPNAQEDMNNSGPILALEALTLATLNVVSLGMLLTGLILWKFDIQDLEDLRRKVRGGLGVDGTGRDERELEEEMEEWVVGVLARKESKDAARDMVNARAREEESMRRNERGKARGLGEGKGWSLW